MCGFLPSTLRVFSTCSAPSARHPGWADLTVRHRGQAPAVQGPVRDSPLRRGIRLLDDLRVSGSNFVIGRALLAGSAASTPRSACAAPNTLRRIPEGPGDLPKADPRARAAGGRRPRLRAARRRPPLQDAHRLRPGPRLPGRATTVVVTDRGAAPAEFRGAADPLPRSSGTQRGAASRRTRRRLAPDRAEPGDPGGQVRGGPPIHRRRRLGRLRRIAPAPAAQPRRHRAPERAKS